MAASSTLKGVSDRYAHALFDLAAQSSSLPAVEKELVALKDLSVTNADFSRLILSPAFSADDQLKAVDAIATQFKFSDIVGNFLRVIAKNRRLFALPGMVESFVKLAADHRGEMTADVTSAQKLTADERKTLKAALKAKYGKDVAFNESVDPTLLGGLVVKIGSQMIDTSIKTKLNSLKTLMKEVG